MHSAFVYLLIIVYTAYRKRTMKMTR